MPTRLLGGLSNWTMGNLMTVLTRDRAAQPYLSTRTFAPALRTAVPCRGTASLTVASYPNPPLPSLLILHPIPLCPPALPTHPLHRLHSSHPSCHTRSPPRQRSLRHVSSSSSSFQCVSPLPVLPLLDSLPSHFLIPIPHLHVPLPSIRLPYTSMQSVLPRCLPADLLRRLSMLPSFLSLLLPHSFSSHYTSLPPGALLPPSPT